MEISRKLCFFGVYGFSFKLMIIYHLIWSEQGANSLRAEKAFKPADIMLGGLFPIHKSTEGPCTPLFKEGAVLAEAMVYAVKIVNEKKLLPYNITLGYDIRDTCNKVISALATTLDFVDNRKAARPDRVGNRTTNKTIACKTVAVLGAGNSIISSAVNNIFSIFGVPQIGYASTSRILSNKDRYPTFLRTVPPDSHQGRAIAEIVSHFRWNYVALLASDDIYGRPLAETFKNEANKLGVCMALDILIPYNPTSEAVLKIVKKLRNAKNVEVVLLFTSEREASDILRLAGEQKITKKVWIASDSWADSPKIAEENYEVAEGMFGIINQPILVPEFMEYFYSLNLINSEHNPWFKEFWEDVFNCADPEKRTAATARKKNIKRKECTGDEKTAEKILRTNAIFSRVSYVLDAVFSVVYSFRKICETDIYTQNSSTESPQKTCLERVTPSSVLSRIFNVTFESVTKRVIRFDRNGDGIGSYDIMNLKGKGKGNISFVKVGEYDGQSGVLKLDSHAIHWPGGVTSPPTGRCSSQCLPGSYKVVRKLICCWDCKPCPHGSVSNTSSVTSCTRCLSGKTPNDRRTECVLIPVTFVRWDSTWAWVLIGTIMLCALCCFTTVVIFIYHKQTPVVKAANREISFLLLFSLIVGFVIPLLYIGKPTERKCKAQVVLFGVSFAFCLSVILARINRTIVVFRYSKVSPRSKSKLFKKYLSLFLYNRAQIMLALFLTLIELLLCTAWLLSSPPHVSVRRLTLTESLLICSTESSIGHIFSNAFIILLSFLCTFVAFKSRKLPQNYNEAKFISFAMFVFNFVWLTFVGVFYGTPDGHHNVIINCFAILASNFAILALIFGPKLYIILLRPDLNRISVFRALTAQYTFRSSRRSSALTSDMMASSCVLKENKCVQTSEEANDVKDQDFPRSFNVPDAGKYDAMDCKDKVFSRKFIPSTVLSETPHKLVRMKKEFLRGGFKRKSASDSALNYRVQNSRCIETEFHCNQGGKKRTHLVCEEARSSLKCKEEEEYLTRKNSELNHVTIFITDSEKKSAWSAEKNGHESLLGQEKVESQ